MAATDIGYWVTTLASVVAAIYAVLAYHRPKRPAMRARNASARAPQRPTWIVGALAIVAWAAAAFSYYDRHYVQVNKQDAVEALSADNSRLEVSRWEPIFPPPGNHFFVNAYVVNTGKIAAVGMVHAGLIVASISADAPAPLMEPNLTSFFSLLKAQLSHVPAPASEIYPGSNPTWFTIPPALDAVTATTEDWNSGKLIYVLNVLKYKDAKTPDGKFIYTETCLYYVLHITHLCGSGHNISYLTSDPH